MTKKRFDMLQQQPHEDDPGPPYPMAAKRPLHDGREILVWIGGGWNIAKWYHESGPAWFLKSMTGPFQDEDFRFWAPMPERPPLTAEQRELGIRFARLLRMQLTPREFKLVQQRNANEHRSDCCHSHDFCDANMVMLAAYCQLKGIQENDVDLEASCEDFNAAWDYAAVAFLGRKADPQ